MQATTIKIRIGPRYVEMTEPQLEKLNSLLSTCDVGGTYDEDDIKKGRRMQIRPKLTVDADVVEPVK